MKPKAFVFDAYGTLFDANSYVLKCDEIPGTIAPKKAFVVVHQLQGH